MSSSSGDALVIDLRDCAFMDAGGLGLLIDTADRVGARGRRLEVRNAPSAVRRLFEITGTEAVVRVEE